MFDRERVLEDRGCGPDCRPVGARVRDEQDHPVAVIVARLAVDAPKRRLDVAQPGFDFDCQLDRPDAHRGVPRACVPRDRERDLVPPLPRGSRPCPGAAEYRDLALVPQRWAVRVRARRELVANDGE